MTHATTLLLVLVGQVSLPSALPADAGPLMFGPRDPRYAVLSLSDAQVRQYVTAESAFRQRVQKARADVPNIRGLEVVNRVIAEGVKELEGILSPLQLDLARQINLDYRLPEGMRHLRLTPDQWEPLLRINRRFDAMEQKALNEMNSRGDANHLAEDTRRLNGIQDERRNAIRAILTPSQLSEITQR